MLWGHDIFGPDSGRTKQYSVFTISLLKETQVSLGDFFPKSGLLKVSFLAKSLPSSKNFVDFTLFLDILAQIWQN